MTTVRLAALALVFIAACATASPPPGPAPASGAEAAAAGMGWEPNTDRPGADYTNFAVRLPQECREACARDLRCRAFTDRGGRCWLKQTVPNAVTDTCCVSGAKVGEPDLSPPGSRAVSAAAGL